MTLKNKILFIILSILTLGIYPILVYRAGGTETKTELSSSTKPTVNLVLLRKALGGVDNVAGVEYTHTKLKIFLKNTKLADNDVVRKLKGVSGLVISSVAITIIVGNSAKEMAKQL